MPAYPTAARSDEETGIICIFFTSLLSLYSTAEGSHLQGGQNLERHYLIHPERRTGGIQPGGRQTLRQGAQECDAGRRKSGG
nr:MAG TPA: hypothetical protein [Caudoviricetes sp.]